MIFRGALLLLLAYPCVAQTTPQPAPQVVPSPLTEIVRVEAQPLKGFFYPYYLYLPPGLRNAKNKKAEHTLIVVPNNTGKDDDDPAIHERAALRGAERIRSFAASLNIAALIPGFPRPRTGGKMYTHALDRDTLLTNQKQYQRLDLQLIRMIDDARGRLRADGLRFDAQVLMFGFSASGMFTNRFAFLHPERVKAAAVGSPGGWAIAPVESWKGRALRYPIGVADFKAVSGATFNLRGLKKVPLFIFMGDEDTNDSVPYTDSYDPEDKELIFDLFGKTMLERWQVTRVIYGEHLPAAILKLYPGVGHTQTQEMKDDITAFSLSIFMTESHADQECLIGEREHA